MKRTKGKMTKQEYRKVLIFILSTCGLSLAFLILGIILMDTDVTMKVSVPIMCVGLLFFGVMLVVFFANLGRVLEYTKERNANHINNGEHLIINGVTKDKIYSRLAALRFKENVDGYFWKRKFSLKTDYANYFVCVADVKDGVENTVKRELEQFDLRGYQHSNISLLLFLYSKNGKEENLDWLKMAMAQNIAGELAQMLYTVRRNNMVAVLIDGQTDKAYLPLQGKFGAYIYNAGVKMIKKITKE